MTAPTKSDIARIIWETSRKDEGTISATGADIIANTLINKFIILDREEIEHLIEQVKREVFYNDTRNNPNRQD